MLTRSILAGLAAALAILPLGALAAPAEAPAPTAFAMPSKTVEKRVDCADIDMFSVAYFGAQSTMTPTSNTCLFYTRRTNGETESLSNTAKNYACNNGLTTIWNLWPGPTSSDMNFYNDDDSTDNWLRCIMGDANSQAVYFQHMSAAFALACSGHVLVMTDDPSAVPSTGIWYGTEFPTIQGMGGGIIDITAVDVNGENGQRYWMYSSSKKRDENGTSVEDRDLPTPISRRDFCGPTGTSEPDGEDWFG